MAHALLNCRVLTAAGLETGLAVLCEGAHVSALTHPDDPRVAAAQVHDLRGALLLPGFIDIQVNGGGGVLFNEMPTVEGIRRIGAAHRRFGTTGFLPTVISADPALIGAAIAAVGAAIAAGVPGVLGIHLEGPFLNPLRKGVHESRALRAPDASSLELLTSLHGGTTLLTLAPELVAPALLRQLRGRGVVLAAGHSNATYVQTQAALAAGVTGFTHLFNAMSPLTSREPGVVGAALADPDSWCGIIVDGHHVDPVVLRIALRAKRHDKFMLVTDAMPIVGTGEQSFELQGRRIGVRGDYCVAEDGTLAGTALTMAAAVRNATTLLELPLPQAVRMASQYPADFLGLGGQFGRIAPGHRASFVIADEELNVLSTWIDGVPA